jgi:hypothetical protein
LYFPGGNLEKSFETSFVFVVIGFVGLYAVGYKPASLDDLVPFGLWFDLVLLLVSKDWTMATRN